MKKPKKTSSGYCNYKGFLSKVLLLLVDGEYRFLWRDCGSSGSCSDTQIFNRSDLRSKIEDGSLGLPPPEPLGEEGPDLHYFLLCADAFGLMPSMVKPHGRRHLKKRRKNSQIQDLLGQEGGGKRLWNLSEPLQGTTGHHGAKAKGCQRHCVYMYGVAQHDEDTPGRGRLGTNPRK